MTETGAIRSRVALVTGGARGNGLAVAKGLAATGASVFLTDLGHDLPHVPYALSTEAVLAEAHAAVAALPGVDAARVGSALCDVRDSEAVDAAFAAAEALLGPVNILVNNAGVLVLHPLPEVCESEWDVQLDVIAKGTFLCCRRALPGMNAGGWGRIINIASVSGHRALGTGVAYTAAKHAVVGLTKSLAKETARQGVTVNAVCPGTVLTPLLRGTAEALGDDVEQALPHYTARHMSGKALAPEDVAAAAVFLASESASGITGTSVFVDDGWHAH